MFLHGPLGKPWKHIFMLKYVNFIKKGRVELSLNLGLRIRIINTIAIPLGWKLPHSPQAGAAASQQGEPTGSMRRENGRLQLRNHHPRATLCITCSILAFFSVPHFSTLTNCSPPHGTNIIYSPFTGKELWKVSKPTANNSPSH